MVDVFNSEKRSKIMASVKNKNTRPELTVRKILHSMGYRFRLHRKDLPGTPDIVLPKYRKVIFVHGCFWHGHDSCPRARLPETNRDFWEKKINKNKIRDEANIQKLLSLGWDPIIVWNCEIKDVNKLKSKLNFHS
jgi:DNA mismatch endonuclease (patch repair protein)